MLQHNILGIQRSTGLAAPGFSVIPRAPVFRWQSRHPDTAQSPSSRHVGARASGDEPTNTTTTSGMLATPASQSAAYAFLTASSIGFGASALLLPTQLLHLALPDASIGSLDPTFIRIAGATMILSAAVEYCLKDAADNNRLTSATYQKLQLGSVVKSLGYLAAFAQAQALWNPVLLALYPTAAAASVVITIATYKAVAGSLAPPAFEATPPKNATAWTYLVFAALYLATARACYSPEAIYLGDITLVSDFLKHTWCPGFLLAAAVCLVQMDAAGRGRLGASTFKKLNLGLAGLELVYGGLLAGSMVAGQAEVNEATVPNLVGSFVIAGFCLYQYATAKK